MELLRKVKCSDRLPEENKEVLFTEFIESKTKGKGYIQKYLATVFDNIIFLAPSSFDGEQFECTIEDVKNMHWYEEINIEELLQKQRELCAKEAKTMPHRHSNYDIVNKASILNAKLKIE